MIQNIPNEILEQILADKKIRTTLARESHAWFFVLYLGHYAKYPYAPFHDEFIKITENEDVKNAIVVAFRGSAKSTFFTLSYVLWAILGKQQRKFILILGHTMYQARTYMKNIKEELETNDLLRADLGPFREENEWQAFSLVIPKHNARITSASFEQGIRGLRHRQHRPDLIICDDVEDLESVKTLEGRDKVHEWLTGEVIPAGDRSTRLFVVGNLLHEDSLIMRLKKIIEEEHFSGIFRMYPFTDDEGKVAWPGKFSNEKIITEEKNKIGNDVAWQREYLLRIVPDEDRIVQPEWIKRYSKLPSEKTKDYRFTITAIDLAISKNESADYTAMVSAMVFGEKENLRIYILPNPINERLSFLEAQNRAEILSKILGNGVPTKLIVENVAYQAAFIEMMNQRGIPTEGFQVQGNDKRARQSTAASRIQWGKVFFPESGADALISQLVNFGFQKHDDLADAFAILIIKIIWTKAHHLFITRIDDSGNQKPMTPEEQTEYALRLEQEYERGLVNDSMAQALRRYSG